MKFNKFKFFFIFCLATIIASEVRSTELNDEEKEEVKNYIIHRPQTINQYKIYVHEPLLENAEKYLSYSHVTTIVMMGGLILSNLSPRLQKTKVGICTSIGAFVALLINNLLKDTVRLEKNRDEGAQNFISEEIQKYAYGRNFNYNKLLTLENVFKHTLGDVTGSYIKIKKK